jgi:hypothetical protein
MVRLENRIGADTMTVNSAPVTLYAGDVTGSARRFGR